MVVVVVRCVEDVIVDKVADIERQRRQEERVALGISVGWAGWGGGKGQGEGAGPFGWECCGRRGRGGVGCMCWFGGRGV